MKYWIKSRWVLLLADSSGQMSIFVALIFQVLFVFFAMAINIGLLVHDKINLQNSVDLAAYYGAQRMAETMNAMSHINFQIRQDYKVFSYRLRVIGSLGFDDHPTRTGANGETAWNGGAATTGAVCNSWLGWAETTDKSQNICRATDHEIRELPPLPVIAGFIPINVVVSAFVDRVRALIQSTCENQKDLNWLYAASTFHMYRMSVAKRKSAFRALAVNLSQPMENVLDMDALPIAQGMRLTLEKNLTQANFDSLGEVQLINGLEDEAVTGLPSWLAEIFITPQVFYVFHQGTLGACQNTVRNVRNTAGVNTEPTLAGSIAGEPATPELHSSLGFEKNPWRMAYVGIKATTAPRKPFAPFGNTITMTARAFAKPFGGRMGPWHKERWAQSSEISGDGPGEVDTLVVPRIPAPGDATVITPAQAGLYVPNFSKYPGDQLGLRSNLAQNFTPEFIRGRGGTDQFRLRADFAHINQIQNPDGDPLSYSQGLENSEATPGGTARTMELAIAAPNLFDITYYSIEPNFDNNYGGRAIWGALNVAFPRDLGSFLGENRIFDSQIQVGHANNRGRRSANGLQFYVVTEPTHLLTGWHQRAESDYTLDPERFGRCEFEIPERESVPAYPALCLKGGRSGYSVKLVSKNYLLFDGHGIGGVGESAAPILNPPPEDF